MANKSLYQYPTYFYRANFEDIVIPGSTKEKSYLAIWNGHEFEVYSPRWIGIDGGGGWQGWDLSDHPHEFKALLYHPIDPRIRVEDVRGATQAYLNGAGTHWLFSHCDDDYHKDKELEIVAVVHSLFNPIIESRLNDVLGFLGNTLLNKAMSKYNLAKSFRDKVVAQVRVNIRELHIGWFHQNPNHSHVHILINQALHTVLKEYKLAGDGARVEDDYQAVLLSLANTHTHETRWDQVARIEAESKAKEGEDGTG